jgi:hypothetical protein
MVALAAQPASTGTIQHETNCYQRIGRSGLHGADERDRTEVPDFNSGTVFFLLTNYLTLAPQA